MKLMTALASAVLGAIVFSACTRDAHAMDGQQIEQQYGVPGAYNDTITTSDGSLKGTLVPYCGKRRSGASLHSAEGEQRPSRRLSSRRGRAASRRTQGQCQSR